MSSEQRPDINIAADEINALIHAYLVDSGFIHSAFVLRGEANLDRSPLAKLLFPRGQLVELLTKALLYIEVETHWKKLPEACNQPFSLTGTHTCKFNFGKNTSALAHNVDNGAMWTEPEQPKLFSLQVSSGNGGDDEMTDSSDTSLPPPGKNELPATLQHFIPSHEQEIFQCNWNPVYGSLLATGSKDSYSAIWMVDLTHGHPIREFRVARIAHCVDIPLDKERDVSCIEWNKDGTFLATASMDPTVRVWRKATLEMHFCIKEHTDTVGVVRFSPNGKYLLSVGLDGNTIIWDVDKKKVMRKYSAPDVDNGPGLQDAVWISDSSFAVTWPGFLIHIFSTTGSMPFRTFRGHTDELNVVRVSPDRKMLSSISDDKTARIWALEPLKMTVKDGEIVPTEGSVGGADGQGCLHVLRKHKSTILNCKWAPLGRDPAERIFVTVSDDYMVCIWDAAAGTLLKTLKDHKRDVYGLAMSPDAQYYCTASMDGWLYIYSAGDWEMVCSWTDRSKPGERRSRSLYEVDWHKDGNFLAVCIAAGDMAILDVSHLNAKPAITLD